MEKATRQFTKVHNIRLVLKTVYDKSPISRADLARATGLTRATISEIVGGLIERGFLEEVGVGSSAGGKPPILVSLRANARQVICADLKPDEFEVALVDLRGSIRCRRRWPTAVMRGEALVGLLVEAIDQMASEAEAPLIGIGVIVPGLTDPLNGIVRRSVQLDWTDLALKQPLEARFELPIYLVNDSHAAALAEYTFGEHSQNPNLIVVRAGDGISCGIILSGRLHHGDGFGAGEIGHLTVVEDGRLCSCGKTGCLETVATSRAVLRAVREAAAAPASQGRSGMPAWEDVLRRYAAGEETATAAVNQAGRYLGFSIASLVSILNVDHIVFTGSFTAFGEPFLNAVREEVRTRSLAKLAGDTRISNTVLGPENLILGASAVVLSNELGLP